MEVGVEAEQLRLQQRVGYAAGKSNEQVGIQPMPNSVEITRGPGLLHSARYGRQHRLGQVVIDLAFRTVLESADQAVGDHRWLASTDVIRPRIGSPRQPDPAGYAVVRSELAANIGEPTALGVDNEHGPIGAERGVDEAAEGR